MSESHTPGPWRAVPQPGQTVGVHTYTHCVMYGDDSIADTLTEADANLIAAAPTMLEALRTVRDLVEFNDVPREEIWRTIDAAIAKAGGAA